VEKTSLCPMFETVRTGLVGEEHGTVGVGRRPWAARETFGKLYFHNGWRGSPYVRPA
jgi:hypothetical protein